MSRVTRHGPSTILNFRNGKPAIKLMDGEAIGVVWPPSADHPLDGAALTFDDEMLMAIKTWAEALLAMESR